MAHDITSAPVIGAAPSVLRAAPAESSPPHASLPLATAPAAAEMLWSGCDNCPRIVCAELTASSSYEANGIGDTHQCGYCLGWDADSIRAAIADAVEVVAHPAEMGPHQDAFCTACGNLVPVTEVDSDGECERCGYLGPGYTSRGDAHLMAVTAPGVR